MQRTDFDLSLELPAAPESVTRARHAIVDFDSLAREGDVALAVSEAVGNAVVHAYRGSESGTITVRARSEPGRLLVIVSDDGGGIRPHLESRGLGVGVGLMREVTDELRIESSSKGTTVS